MSTLYSEHTVQWAHCTVSTLYSEHTVQWAHCTVSPLYREGIMEEELGRRNHGGGTEACLARGAKEWKRCCFYCKTHWKWKVGYKNYEKVKEVYVSYCWFSFSLCFHSQHFRDLTLYHVFFAIGAIACFFLTFWYPSQLKHLVLRAFLAGHLPKKLSQIGVLDERGMKK